MIGRAGLGHSTARLQIDERECRQTAYLRQVIWAAASRKPLHAELSRLEPIREHGSATIEVARTVVVERVERGYPMVPDDAAPVDRGHVIPHLSGGEFGPTEIGMRNDSSDVCRTLARPVPQATPYSSRIESAGSASTICMVRRLTVTILANRSMMYRGSPTSRLQSFGSLMIPDAVSVLIR